MLMRRNHGVLREFFILIAVNCIIRIIRALFKLPNRALYCLVKVIRFPANIIGVRFEIDQDLKDVQDAFKRDPATAGILRRMVLEARISQMRWVLRGVLFYLK